MLCAEIIFNFPAVYLKYFRYNCVILDKYDHNKTQS